MSNFIPLGGPDLISQILANATNLVGFDIIELTDAQKVTGELFFKVIGDDFAPYKDLETFAAIEADTAAIALVNASTNAQILIEGTQPSGFVIDAPALEAYSGNDGFILLKVSAQASTPEESLLQYRVNGGGWQTLAQLTNQVGTEFVVIPELPNNETYVIEARQSIFGTQSAIVGKTVVTTPTVENWNAFFNDAATRDHFYTDSYTNNNTYGDLAPKTVMEMIFGSEAVVGAIAEDNNTLTLVELNQDNIDLLVTQANGMLGLAESTNGMNYVVDNSAYRTAIETTATARDAVTASSVAMPIVAASQDMLDVIEASADFRASVTDSAIARNAFNNSQLAIDTITSSADFMVNLVNSQDFMDLVVVNQNFLNSIEASGTALSALGTTAIARDTYTASQLAMQAVVASQNYLDTIEGNGDFRASVIASQLARNEFVTTQLAMATVVDSQNFMNDIVSSQDFMDDVVASQVALDEILTSELAMTTIETTEIARDTYTANQLSMQSLVTNQFFLNTVEGSANFRTSVVESQVAMFEFSNSQLALNTVDNSANFRASVLSSQTAKNEFVVSQLALDTVVASENFSNNWAVNETAMLLAANTPLAFEAFIASQTAMTAVDNVDLATRILILEQTATQDYNNFTNVADFIDDATAMAEVASSQDAMRALIASANAFSEKLVEPIALNEVFASEPATLIVANNADAVTQVSESTIAMGVLDTYDLALRIMLLELTNQDYTQFNTVTDVLSDTVSVDDILSSTPNAKILEGSFTCLIVENNILGLSNNINAFNFIVSSEKAKNIISTDETAFIILVLLETNQDYTNFANIDAITSSQIAMQEIAQSEISLNLLFSSSEARVSMWNSAIAEKSFRDNPNAMSFIAENFSIFRESERTGTGQRRTVQNGPLFCINASTGTGVTSRIREARFFVHFQDGITSDIFQKNNSAAIAEGDGANFVECAGRMFNNLEIIPTMGGNVGALGRRSGNIVIMT